MRGENKVEKMKTAMQFVIKKLTPIDCLSVVTFTFADDAVRLIPSRQITDKSQGEIEKVVNGLVARGNTNITAGLKTSLKVLGDRNLDDGHCVGIMLMSHGQQNRGGDAAQVPLGNTSVFTFGFGQDHEPKVLKAIADKSIGGTFSDVQNTDNLSIAFSQCLAGLLSVVSEKGNSVTIFFGTLYDKEIRKVIVDLLIPAVPKPRSMDVLVVTYKYSYEGEVLDIFPVTASVMCVRTAAEEEREEVTIEESRIETARMIKEARLLADDRKLEAARDIIVEAQNLLEDADTNNPLIKLLISELAHFEKLLNDEKIYKSQGLPFALSSETSHNRQRFAARGDDPEKARLFSTPRMDAYLEQAQAFVEVPSKPLPTAEEDLKQEVAANPLGSVAGALSYYLQAAIQSLQSIQKILDTSTR